MRKAILIFAALIFIVSALFAGEWVALNSAAEPFTVQVLSASAERTVLKYSVNGYSIDRALINGRYFTLFEKMRKESIIEEKGDPRLPRINRSIAIPNDGVMGYEIIASDYIEINNIDVAPSKGNILRSVDPATVPYTFSDAYSRDAFYPGEVVDLGEPYIVRDVRGLVVELNAFQYNPVTRTLRIYTDVTIEVKKTASGGVNTLTRQYPLTSIDRQFAKIYQRHFLNYGGLDYPTLYEDGGMLIICYDSFMDLLEPLVEWKNQKGIPTEMVALSVVGANTTAIQNYINNYYYTNDLAYVLLIGDHPQLPTFSSGSDPVYSLIVGGDNYPDIFVGRFSAENRDQAATQVERTIDYEMNPQAGADWYHKGLGVASNQGSGIGHHGEADNEHITLIAYKLLNYTYTQIDSAYDNWGTANMVSNFLNNGRSIINYCGHGSTTSWGSTGFNNGNVNNLVNDNMLPHIVSVACNNGTFTTTTCFAEAWLRATNNVTGEPTGAVGTYMSKISQSWAPPMDMQDEGVDLMVADEMRTFGGICFNGSMLMIDLNGGTGVTEFKAWTIFGDPSLYLRNDTPVALTVNHNPILYLGVNTFDVTVIGGGGPLEDATVCGMNDEIYAVATTNAAGQATLEFAAAPSQPGEFTLTVSGWNTMPYIVQVQIVPAEGPYIVYEGHEVQDNIHGNNNGQLDYGEEVDLGITIENVGVEVANNVSAIISCANPLVTINDDSAYFGTIAANTTMTMDHAYWIEVSPEVEDMQYLLFTLTATNSIDNWETSFAVLAHAPVMNFSELVVDDIASGNGNMNLDPGETADLQVTLLNEGSSNLDGLQATLTSSDPYVTINSGISSFAGLINPGGEAEVAFNVTVSAGCPQEHEVSFELAIAGGGEYSGSAEFSTVVGDILFAPTGPDNYGYLAYDCNDFPEFTEFDWIEICPDSGGTGTEIAFTLDDQVLYFVLPFTFQYYGVEYDTFTICSNGFIAMGITTDTDYSNSAIPNSDGPPAMIAPYWEDMSPQRQNSGGVWMLYDDEEEILIIEFNHVEQYAPTGNFETFQAILYNPAEYPTMTGDGRIKFQYKDMSNASLQEGTMGVENHLENDGLEYCYDGDYDIHATPLTDGSAVMYSTPMDVPDLTITLTPASLPIVIPAQGGSFNYEIEIANNGATTAYFDAWIEAVLPNTTVLEVLLRSGIALGPTGMISRNMTQNVPGNAPSGDYTYRGKVGNHPNVIYDSDQFAFEKLAVDGAQILVNNWNLSGWESGEQLAGALTPESYFLAQNYPNPFNPQTTISFGLPEASKVSLKVYNVLGETVATLLEGYLPGGYYNFQWQADGASSGIYFYKLQTEGFAQVKKMMLVR